MNKYGFSLVLFILFLFEGCNVSLQNSEKNTAFLCEPLDSCLRAYISDYNQDSIFRLFFYQIGDTNYVEICREEVYDSNDSAYIDYYAYIDNKLIICFSLDTCSRDSLLYKEKMKKYYGRIDGTEQAPDDSRTEFYDSHPAYLKVISKDSIVILPDIPRRIKGFDNFRDDVVINDDINSKLNEYMEKYDGFHYFLRFANYKNEDYVTIGRSDVHAEKDVIGHFWRKGNMVIIYNSGKEDLSRYINLDSIVPYTDHSINARKGKPEFYFRPDIGKYKIDSKGKLMKVDLNSPIYVFI